MLMALKNSSLGFQGNQRGALDWRPGMYEEGIFKLGGLESRICIVCLLMRGTAPMATMAFNFFGAYGGHED